MNKIVYTITDPDEEELGAEEIKDFYWDEIPLFLSTNNNIPKMGDNVLWVVGYGGVAARMKLRPDMVMGEVVEYRKSIEEMPNKAKREFIKACFNEVI